MIGNPSVETWRVKKERRKGSFSVLPSFIATNRELVVALTVVSRLPPPTRTPPPGYVWQSPEIFLVVLTGRGEVL